MGFILWPEGQYFWTWWNQLKKMNSKDGISPWKMCCFQPLVFTPKACWQLFFGQLKQVCCYVKVVSMETWTQMILRLWWSKATPWTFWRAQWKFQNFIVLHRKENFIVLHHSQNFEMFSSPGTLEPCRQDRCLNLACKFTCFNYFTSYFTTCISAIKKIIIFHFPFLIFIWLNMWSHKTHSICWTCTFGLR